MQIRPNKLTRIAEEAGVSVHELIREAIRVEGSVSGAARRLNVSRNTITHHLGQMNLTVVTETRARLVKRDA